MRPLDRLLRLAPPPERPRAAHGDWNEIERRLGVVLPDDFKALIECYGSGGFRDFLRPLNPFVAEGGLLDVGTGMLSADGELRAEFTEAYPYALFPEPGGLLPWGRTDNGDGLYWLTTGVPNAWGVVAGRFPEFARFDLGVAAFLQGWLAGELAVPGFALDSEEMGATDGADLAGAFLRVPPFVPDWAAKPATASLRLHPVPASFEAQRDAVARAFVGVQLWSQHRQEHHSQCRLVDPKREVEVRLSENAHHGPGLELLYAPEKEMLVVERLRALLDATGWKLRMSPMTFDGKPTLPYLQADYSLS